MAQRQIDSTKLIQNSLKHELELLLFAQTSSSMYMQEIAIIIQLYQGLLLKLSHAVFTLTTSVKILLLDLMMAGCISMLTMEKEFKLKETLTMALLLLLGLLVSTRANIYLLEKGKAFQFSIMSHEFIL